MRYKSNPNRTVTENDQVVATVNGRHYSGVLFNVPGDAGALNATLAVIIPGGTRQIALADASQCVHADDAVTWKPAPPPAVKPPVAPVVPPAPENKTNR